MFSFITAIPSLLSGLFTTVNGVTAALSNEKIAQINNLCLEGSVDDFLKFAPIKQLAQLHFLSLSGFLEFGPKIGH